MMLEAMLVNDCKLIGQLRDIRYKWLNRDGDMSNSVIIMSYITYRTIVREMPVISKETHYEPKNILGFKVEIDNRLEPFRIRIVDRERKPYRTHIEFGIDYGSGEDIWNELIKHERRNDMKLPKRVCFNKKATILLWQDDTKTIVKCSNNDEQDPVLGFLYAYFEKHSHLSKTKARKYLDEVRETYNKSEK